jgi:hypothetical protein
MRLGDLGAALLLATVLQLWFVDDARAYLDPGTGSFIFQTVVAMLVGAGFTVKTYWHRIKLMFGGKSTTEALPARAKEEGGQD